MKSLTVGALHCFVIALFLMILIVIIFEILAATTIRALERSFFALSS